VAARQAAARSAGRARKAAAAPTPPDPEETLDHINELSRTARTLWFGLLTYFAFVGVTLMGVIDADFFLAERQTQLPLVGVSIPTELFFFFAPILGVAFYNYLHHHLMKLWKVLATAPAEVRGLPLSDHLIPWIVTDMALDLRPDRSLRPQPLPMLANVVTWVLVFPATPFVLAAFWWRSMPAHSWWMTLVCCGLSLLLSLFVMWESGRALSRLRRNGERPAADRPDPAGFRRKTILWLAMGALLTGIGYTRTVEPLGDQWKIDRHYLSYLQWRDAEQLAGASQAQREEVELRHRDGVEAALWNRWPLILSSAQLQNVVFVEKPGDWRDFQTARTAYRVAWCKNEGLPPEVCGPVPGADAVAPAFLDDQQALWCARMFPDAGERPRECPKHLSALDDRFAEDWQTERRAARAALPHRDLAGRDLRQANLSGAQMEGAVLIGAQMEGAVLSGAQMEGAVLIGAQMEGAVLIGAQMEGAVLQGAQMEGAVLSFANLQSADLSDCSAVRTSLRSADFTGAKNLTQQAVNAAWDDSGTILPEKIARPDHWDSEVIEGWMDDPKYDAWIAAGAPPGKPLP
jgi:uncharacterized protein YjbI with pentapeptide repeats